MRRRRPMYPAVSSGRRWARWALWVVLAVLASCGDSGAGPGVEAIVGALDDGVAGRWTTASPQSMGVSPTVLGAMGDRIDAGHFGEISSLLVLRSGVLVYERYWGEWDPDDLHRVYSVTKSVTSLALGIADGEGRLAELDTPLLDLFPEYPSVAAAEGKDGIVLEHVLQMRTGLEWDELSTNYDTGTNPTASLIASDDWIEFVLDLPLDTLPGHEFVYNSGVSMLMSGVLENEFGESAESYVARSLFDPLGIEEWVWSEGPGGLTNTGWGLRLEPRDMAAVGQLVLQEGTWDGVPIVPREWIARSGLPASTFEDGRGYGYQWWLPSGPDRPMAGWGWGGQFVVVLPSIDLVVVSTAENYLGGGFDPYVLADFGYEAVPGG
ncbi:MAG: beta-lactamase family protein [Gemmatimonadetes bacterium]|nr:beta-lactamase family protein [Gemmatimonadota bacterium]MBT8404710.1 beta-lactamase family protein [Gemmatimonadota bacterium]NNK65088.1 serine hydrolase [Gemmatimonadota bacterium]